MLEYSEEDPPFTTEEVIKVCRSMIPNTRFLSPKNWAFDIFCFNGPTWMLTIKDEGKAMSHNSIAIESDDLKKLERALNDNRLALVKNYPYQAELKL
jgi:hypothetical protein